MTHTNYVFFSLQGPSNYAFGYAVRDDHSGDDFSHTEVRDGYKTTGEYRVMLPDGRTQVLIAKLIKLFVFTNEEFFNYLLRS
jgi:hypothetical protein